MTMSSISAMKQHILSLTGAVKESRYHHTLSKTKVNNDKARLRQAKRDLSKIENATLPGSVFSRGMMKFTRFVSGPFARAHKKSVLFLEHPERYAEVRFTKIGNRLLELEAGKLKPNFLKGHILAMVDLVEKMEEYVGKNPTLVSKHGLLDLRDKLEVKINHLRPPINMEELKNAKKVIEQLADTVVNEITNELGEKKHA